MTLRPSFLGAFIESNISLDKFKCEKISSELDFIHYLVHQRRAGEKSLKDCGKTLSASQLKTSRQFTGVQSSSNAPLPLHIMEDFDLLKLREKSPLSEMKNESLLNKAILSWPNRAFQLIFLPLLAVRNQNQKWLEDIYNELINIDTYSFFQGHLDWRLYSHLWEKRKKLAEMIIFLRNKSDNKDLYEMYVSKLIEFSPLKLKKYLKGKLNKKEWSLSELRDFLKSTYWRNKSFGHWFSLYIERASVNEIKNTVLKFADERFYQQKFKDKISTLSFYFPNAPYLRNLILRRLKKLSSSFEDGKAYYFLGILEDPILTNIYFKKYPKEKAPTFQIKRRILEKLHKRGPWRLFSSFLLLSMGDYDRKYQEGIIF